MIYKKIIRWFRRPADPSGHVYYARLRTSQGVFYKLGYTSKPSLYERMSYGGAGDERLIEKILLFSFQVDAWDIEQTLLDHFDKQRAFGKYSNDPSQPLAGNGQSELFRNDVLGLDEILYQETTSSKTTGKSVEIDDQAEGCLMTIIGLVLIPFTFGLSLFFIAGGLGAIFSSGDKSSQRSRSSIVKRPKHQPDIQLLLDRLQEKKVDEVS